jgi:capsular exopolysaccharide synthesis family protein
MVVPAEEDAPSVQPFHIRRLFLFLLKFWWLPLVTLVVGLGAAGGFVWWKPPTYVSKARMWETIKLRLPEGSLFAEDVQNFLGTQTELLQSETLRELALARLRGASNNIPLEKDGEPMLVDIRVVGASKSSVFRLEASSADAAYTRAYLDALMNVYLEYKRNVRKVVSGDTLASITEQVQRAERDLKDAQDILAAFQRTNNFAILEEEGRTSGGYLARLRTQLSDLQLEYRLLLLTSSNSAPAATIETNASPELADSLITFPSPMSSVVPPEHQSAFKELELLKLQRDKLSRYLRPKHPKIVKLDADIERGMKLIEIYQRQNQDQLEASRKAIELKIENVLLSIKEWEAKVVAANSRMADAERLKVNVQRFQSIYDRLVLLVQNVGISRNIDHETLAILEPAGPARRTYTHEISLLGLGGFAGFGLGLGLIVLLMVRDDRFTSLLEVNEKLGGMIVGQVPEVPGLRPNATLPLVEAEDQRHAYAESFRNLRSALIFMTAEAERPRVVLITSALPHEGKSTIAANLARTLALGGSRVVLVDADLRKGVLYKLVGLEREPGLTEILREPGRLEKVVQTNSMANLFFVSSGSALDNCGDAFLSPEFDGILTRLRQQFDYVIIDSSPVFAADDASTLAPKVDGTLFVVRSRFSRAGAVREALGQLYQRNSRVLGVVFNQADASARDNYYYKYSDYYPNHKSE